MPPVGSSVAKTPDKNRYTSCIIVSHLSGQEPNPILFQTVTIHSTFVLHVIVVYMAQNFEYSNDVLQ